MDRLIVSNVPGTTRETVELDLDYEPKILVVLGNLDFLIPLD